MALTQIKLEVLDKLLAERRRAIIEQWEAAPTKRERERCHVAIGEVELFKEYLSDAVRSAAE